jgi:CheY-like chemotaxis protein
MIPERSKADCPNIKTILLAEDDPDDQEFITDALLQIDKNLTIHTVSNGNEVLRFLEKQEAANLPQLLILDYNLPERDGADVLKQLQQDSRYKQITMIVWSTSNAPQYKTRTMQLGAAYYMVKPCTITGIEAMARQMLDLCYATA